MQMIRTSLFCLLIIGSMASCSSAKKDAAISPSVQLLEGDWLVNLSLHDSVILPVNVLITNGEKASVDFVNGEEILTASLSYMSSDSVLITMPYFDSEFLGRVSADGASMTGMWFNKSKGPDYSIAFNASHGAAPRFCAPDSVDLELGKRYEVHFSPDSVDDHYPALGIFTAHPETNSILGTFATETGDYRFLQGNVCGDKLNLSCFDGSHAFLFQATIKGDSLVGGRFFSGNHWQEPWIATVNAEFTLRNPYSLTHVVDSAAIDSTRFIMEDGSRKHLADLRAPDQVVILQIMGSWCPNCLDESEFFKELYISFSDKGLQILPLCFESSDDTETAYRAIHKLHSDLDLPYPMYYGGSRKKSSASAALPALDHIMSYPTSIFIDKKGKVRSVHTGFYGPSTGIYYERYTSATTAMVQDLLSEL